MMLIFFTSDPYSLIVLNMPTSLTMNHAMKNLIISAVTNSEMGIRVPMS